MNEQKNNIGVNNNNEAKPLPQMGTVQDKYGLPPMSSFTNFDNNNTKIDVDNNTSVFDLMDQFESINTGSSMPSMQSVSVEAPKQEIQDTAVPNMAAEVETSKQQAVNSIPVLNNSSDNTNSIPKIFNEIKETNTDETNNNQVNNSRPIINQNVENMNSAPFSLFSNRESTPNNNILINNQNNTSVVNDMPTTQDVNNAKSINNLNTVPVLNSNVNNVVDQPKNSNNLVNFNNQNSLGNDNGVSTTQSNIDLDNFNTDLKHNNSINLNLDSASINNNLYTLNNDVSNNQSVDNSVQEIPTTEIESFNSDNSNDTTINNNQDNYKQVNNFVDETEPNSNVVDNNTKANTINSNNDISKTVVEKPNNVKNKKDKKKGKKVLFIVLLVITLLLVSGVGVLSYFMFFKTDKLVCGMQDYSDEQFFLDESVVVEFKGNSMENAVLTHSITFADEYVDEKDSYLEEVKNQYQGLGYNISFVDNENGFEIKMTFTKKELENWYGIDLKNSSKNKLKKELRSSGYTCK